MSIFDNFDKYKSDYKQICIQPVFPEAAKLELDKGRLPVLHVPNVPLHQGESIHFLEKAVFCSLDWKKSLDQEKGYLYITNNRIFSKGKDKDFSIDLKDIDGIVFYENPMQGIAIEDGDQLYSFFLPNRDEAYHAIELIMKDAQHTMKLLDYRKETYFEKRLQSECRYFIEMFRECNEMIPDELFSDILDRFDKILSDIFHVIPQQNRKISKMRSFMNCYLPAAKKIVQQYVRIDQINNQSVGEAKKKIAESMELIVDAFGRFRDELYDDVAFDAVIEAETLQKKMWMDGLGESLSEK